MIFTACLIGSEYIHPSRLLAENQLNGKIQLEIKKGNIIEADAGAGRILGLFSLSALPRKLFGDFKDTFKAGFNFDTAIGGFGGCPMAKDELTGNLATEALLNYAAQANLYHTINSASFEAARQLSTSIF